MTNSETYQKIIEMIDTTSYYKSPEELNGCYLVAIGSYIAKMCDILEDMKNDKKTTV